MKTFSVSLSAFLAAVVLAATFHGKSTPPRPAASSPSAAGRTDRFQRIPASAVHHQRSGPNIRIAQSLSGNWSGYAVPAESGSAFSQVEGSWTVPAVTGTKGQYTYSSIWVGIDGYATPTVEQIGTEQDWTGKTSSQYAWFEMYPDYAYQIVGFPVNEGDTISASVAYTGDDAGGNKIFELWLRNETAGAEVLIPTSYTTTAAAQLQSAEWIVEAPSSVGRVLPLADFGTASLFDCSADGKWIAHYKRLGLDPLTMVTLQGRRLITKAEPSELTSDQGFTVTWDHQ
jgi:Peptidase A4 family